MEATIEEQRKQLMESGYLIVRDMIPLSELQRLRKCVDVIADRAPESSRSSRVTLTEWVDGETADAVEFCFDARTLDFCRRLMNAPSAAPLGMWVLCGSGTGWHRDGVQPIDTAPLDGLQENLRFNGPPYLQWNIALYDDNFLQIIPGSHLRHNNAEERKIERNMGIVSLPGAMAVDLKAGDGVVYINTFLHGATANGRTKRRTIHMGHTAFGNQGFIHYFSEPIGVDFVRHLSTRGADQCRQFAKLHAQRNDQIASIFHAIVERNREAFARVFETLHPGEYGRMTSLIVLAKIAAMIGRYKDSESDDHRNHRATQSLAERFTRDELDQLRDRFGTLDEKLKADTEQYESLFKSGPILYRFYEMPANFDVADFVASWG